MSVRLRPVQHVGEPRQKPVRGHGDPRRPRGAAQEPRSVDHGSFAREDRLTSTASSAGSSSRSASWIATIVPRACSKPVRIARPLPPFAGAWTMRKRVAAIRQRIEHAARAVGRAVVDDENLARHRQIDGQQPLDDRADGGFFVVDGNDDGQQFAHATSADLDRARRRTSRCAAHRHARHRSRRPRAWCSSGRRSARRSGSGRPPRRRCRPCCRVRP